jgi:transposase
MEIMQTADTTSELAKTQDDLRAVFIENEGLRARVRELQAINEQVKTRLSNLQELADTVKCFADDILADIDSE